MIRLLLPKVVCPKKREEIFLLASDYSLVVVICLILSLSFSKRPPPPPPPSAAAAKGQVEWNNEHSVLNSALLSLSSYCSWNAVGRCCCRCSIMNRE